MNHDKSACKNTGNDEIPLAVLINGAVQHVIKAGIKRPAEQRCTLRDEHIHNDVHPADILIDKIRGRLIKRCENAGKIICSILQIREEIRKAEAAV